MNRWGVGIRKGDATSESVGERALEREQSKVLPTSVFSLCRHSREAQN